MGVGGAGDWEREGVEDESGGPFDQAEFLGIVGFLDACAVEGLLILKRHQSQSEKDWRQLTNVARKGGLFGRLF